MAKRQSGAATVPAIAIPAQAAHASIEWARIWNPIDTDRAHALAAGLPAIILHGTATPALAVSSLLRHHCGVDPTRVVRLGGRISGMVLMPSTETPRFRAQDGGVIGFEMINADGRAAISRGFVALRDART